jgi:hypothetical protein
MLQDGTRWDAPRQLIVAINQAFAEREYLANLSEEVQEPRPTNVWAPLSIQTAKTSKSQVTGSSNPRFLGDLIRNQFGGFSNIGFEITPRHHVFDREAIG